MNGDQDNNRQQQSTMPSHTPSPIVNSRFGMRLGWRIFCTLLLLALLILLSIFSGYSAGAAPAVQSSGSPLVLAFYYTWFDESTWTPEKVPDIPAQPYASRDRAAMGRHIEQAQRAGIDAFLVAWYGPSGESNQTEPNLTALLEEAAARNFKIGILFETDSPFFNGSGDATAALQHALGVHANHPAFLRADGKPVIFFWRPHLWGVETWRSIRDQVDPNRSALWIAEGVDVAYQAVFDGHHLYSNTWNPPADLNQTNQKFARLVAEASQTHGTPKIWVATVMPGYDDTRTGRGNAFARDREGGAYYERSWRAAIDSNPNWIVITSFNEWPEGTYIEPSAAHGDHYLNLTAAWSQQFKSGVTASPSAPPENPPNDPPADPPAATDTAADAASVARAQVAAAPTPEPTTPTAFVTTPILNLRAGPSTDHEVLARMPQEATLSVTGQAPAVPNWWQVEYQGQIGWAHDDYLRLAGPMEVVAQVDAPVDTQPQPAPTIDPTQSGQIASDPVERDGAERATTQSTATVTALLLNLRQGPGTDQPVLAEIAQGTVLSITGRSENAPDWWQVTHAGNEGWVHGEFLQIGSDVAAALQIDPTSQNDAAVTAQPQTPQGRTPSSERIYRFLLGDVSLLIAESSRAGVVDALGEPTEATDATGGTNR